MNITIHKSVDGKETSREIAVATWEQGVDIATAELFADIGRGDGENGGVGDLWNAAPEVRKCLAEGKTYSYADTEWRVTADGDVDFKDGRTVYRTSINVPVAECDRVNGLLSRREEDGLVGKLGYESGTVSIFSASFADKTFVDVRFRAYDDSFGVDAGLFDPLGVELCVLDVRDRLDGTYEFSCGSEDYVVEVRRWDAKPGDFVEWHSDDENYDDELCTICEVNVDGNGETHFVVQPVSDVASAGGGRFEVHSSDCRPVRQPA